jgi:hypothetical protein
MGNIVAPQHVERNASNEVLVRIGRGRRSSFAGTDEFGSLVACIRGSGDRQGEVELEGQTEDVWSSVYGRRVSIVA